MTLFILFFPPLREHPIIRTDLQIRTMFRCPDLCWPTHPLLNTNVHKKICTLELLFERFTPPHCMAFWMTLNLTAMHEKIVDQKLNKFVNKNSISGCTYFLRRKSEHLVSWNTPTHPNLNVWICKSVRIIVRSLHQLASNICFHFYCLLQVRKTPVKTCHP